MDKERVVESYKKLAIVSKHLNEVSNLLNDEVKTLENAIGRLNAGVIAEVPFKYGVVGYGPLGPGPWRIYIKTEKGTEAKMCAFSDAARWQRVAVVEQLPALIEELNRATIELTQLIGEKTDLANRFVEAIRETQSK